MPSNRLQTLTAQLRTELTQQWPEILPFLPGQSQAHTNSLDKTLQAASHETETISDEERAQLAEQLHSLSSLPAGKLQAKDATELAIKLSFITGIPIQFASDNKSLSNTYGTICAQSTQSAPGSTLWTSDTKATAMTPLQSESIDWSLFVSPREISLAERSEWAEPWFMHRLVLLINPHTLVGVVARIDGILSGKFNRYQFGASQAVMTAGSFWAPANHGRAVVCFLGASVPLGTVLNLRSKSMKS